MRLCVIGVLSVLLLCVPALAAHATEHVVIVKNFEFSPADLTIQKNDLVRWEWESGVHTLVDGDPDNLAEAGAKFDAPVNAQNQRFEFVFTETGTIEYFSRTDPSIKGTITVLEGTPVNQKTWGWLKRVFEDPASARNRR